MRTVSDWIDENMNLVYGRTIRLIDSKTRQGVGDMMMFYMDRPVKSYKVTKKFLFIFI